jgi:MFS family permease
MAKLSEVLKNRSFFFLWLGQIISQFGDRLTQMALIGLIYKRAPGSAYELAKLFLFVVIPVFIVGPVAGAYTDRWSRKYTMVISDIIRGFLIVAIIFYMKMVPALKPIYPVYIIVFLAFSVARFFVPAKMAIIPDLVPQEKLLEANSLINTTGMIAAALGFGLGGILISVPSIGVKGGLIIDATTFFISATLILFMRINKPQVLVKEDIYAFGRHIKEIIVKSVFREITDGIRYIFTHRKMHFIIGLLFLLWSGIGASYVVMIVFIQNILSNATKYLGILVMFFGAGLFCGSIIYGRFGQKVSKIKAIFLSLGLGGLFLVQFVILVGLFKNIYVAGILSFIFGASISPLMISPNAIVHELIPDELRGRIFSSLEAVMHLAFLIFMLVASISAEFLKPSNILAAVGIIFLIFGIVGIKRKAV